jgi:hypothetical protein
MESHDPHFRAFSTPISTGIRGKIQVSGPTAELLSGHGKDHWLKPREDAVNAKGKGLLKTFWLEQCAKKKGSSTTSSEAGSRGQIATPFPASDREAMMKQGRLVDWITDLLGSHIRKIVSSVQNHGSHTDTLDFALTLHLSCSLSADCERWRRQGNK